MFRGHRKVSTELEIAATIESLWAPHADGSTSKEQVTVLDTTRSHGGSAVRAGKGPSESHRIREEVFGCIHRKWVIIELTNQRQSKKDLRPFGM